VGAKIFLPPQFVDTLCLKMREPSLPARPKLKSEGGNEKSATFLKIIVSKFLKITNHGTLPPDYPRTAILTIF